MRIQCAEVVALATIIVVGGKKMVTQLQLQGIPNPKKLRACASRDNGDSELVVAGCRLLSAVVRRFWHSTIPKLKFLCKILQPVPR